MNREGRAIERDWTAVTGHRNDPVTDLALATTVQAIYFDRMKTLKLALGIAVVSLVGIGIGSALPPLAPAVLGKNTKKPVFVTGSLIPQYVDVKAIGTNTVSPVRVYTRAEIDRTGQFTAARILVQDPAIQIIGH